MLRPPSLPPLPPPPSSTSPPPRLPRLSVSPSLLLPSERLALGIYPSTGGLLPTHSHHSFTPPPPLPTLPKTPPPPRTASRNDLFSLDWSPVTPNVSSRANSPSPSPSPSLAPIPVPSPRFPSPLAAYRPAKYDLPPSPPSSDRISGRKVTWERKDEVLPVTPTSPPPLSGWPTDSAAARDKAVGVATVRLSATKDFRLGEGRHASVFLASYLPSHLASASSSSPSAEEDRDEGEWQLCAAKCALPDHDSQIATLAEGDILTRVAGHPNVIGLLDIKDERAGDLEGVPGADSDVSRRSSMHSRRESPSGRTDAVPPQAPVVATHGHRLSYTPSNRSTHLEPPIGSPSLDSAGDANHHGAFLSTHYLSPPTGSPFSESSSVASSSLGARERVRRARYSEPPPPRSASLEKEPDMARTVLLLEYCPFGHVMGFLRTRPERVGRERWVRWARELAKAVEWIHAKGLLHADIKPQNILIASDESLRLSDFSMSLSLPLATPSPPLGLGTPAYSPPEFVQSTLTSFGLASDIFSLGVTLSVLLCGHEPFEGMRAVERMFQVGKGAYWEWEERRRAGEAAGGDGGGGGGGGGISRQGSMRGTGSRAQSGGKGLSRAGSIRSVESGRSGAGSVDEEENGEGALNGWKRDIAVARLRAGEDGTPNPLPLEAFSLSPLSRDFEDREEEDEDDNSPSTPSDAFSFGYGQHSAHSTYADGAPLQYFLNGDEVVPKEVRELLRAMMSPRPGERPSAREVVRTLEAVALSEG